jgi:class 3 adenylate cyclase/tetratricopeptide (TPR) repeat protein
MQCPRCHTENRADRRFCGECGLSFASSCPFCRFRNEGGARFCGGCGRSLTVFPASQPRLGSRPAYTPRHLAEKILGSRAALEGERKLVTVLFADIKSSMEMLAHRDPEEARRLLDAVLERMFEAVHRYEGTINQVLGDGVMALFGAPVAHEDHAVRACYAALRMQEAIEGYSAELRRTDGIYLQIRVGLHSGQVVVRSIGSDLHMDYTAVGQTAHLAGRMEQIASPGSILISADVLRLAEGYVAVKPLGPVPVKGLAEAVEVFELIGAGPVRTRLQAAATRGLTRFVGRSEEMEILQNAREQAAVGDWQMVAVVGEAGVGKSRLLDEFIHFPATQEWLILESSSVPYGHATPYLPVIDTLRRYFKIDARDDARTLREKVTGKVLTLDESSQDTIPALLDLLEALPDDHPFRGLHPAQRRRYTVDAFRNILLSESRIQPVLVIFEDLHWDDSPTLELLDGVVRSLSGSRILLLVSYRPEYRDDWNRLPNYRQLQVGPLARQSIEEILLVLLGTNPTLAAVKEFLIERSEGNPFFLEEIVRTLVETGVLSGGAGDYVVAKTFSSDEVPSTVQAVLASRIDRLPAQEKRLLQEAAVIGQDVPFGLLSAISELSDEDLRASVAYLQSADFLYESKLFPDLEYTFRHALTHDVAYGEVLLQRRREIHARIVEAMEALYGDRLAEHIDRIAQHAFLGELWEKALTYLRQAGAKAAERPANREAVALFEQALAALDHLPESRQTLEQAIDIHFEIRNALQPLGDLDRILQSLREAERLGVQLDDQRRLGWVGSYLAEHFRMLGHPESAAEEGERALAIARRLEDLPLQVVTNLPMGLLCHNLGQYRQALDFFRWNVTRLEGDLRYERFGLFGLPSVFSRGFLARSLAELGEFAEAITVGDEGVRLAEAAGQPFSRVYAYLGIGALYLRMGDVHRAISVLERALALGQATHIPVGLAYGASYLGYALALADRVDEGLPLLEQAVDQATSTTFVASNSLRVAYLGEAYLICGRHGEAANAAARALDLACAHGERGHQAYALRLLGEVEARSGDAGQAQAHFQQALLLAGELGMRPLIAHCHWGLARTLDQAGQVAVAASHRDNATALFRSIGMRVWGKP